VVLLALAAGCDQAAPASSETRQVPEVAVVSPVRTSLYWTIQQPGSIEAFEETPLAPKIAGYVARWNVDIGDHVRKGQLLAELWVPDLAAQVQQKEAAVVQAEAVIVQSKEALRTAEAAIDRAEANLKLAQASRIRAEAEHVRWKSQYARERKLLAEDAIATRQLEATTSQLRAAEASQGETSAGEDAARATVTESKAQRARAAADVRVAEAALQSAHADRDHARAMLNYARIEAPFDGVITQRNISRGDFVQPPGTSAQSPLYVVQRRDLMRVFVEVPETDAVWVKDGNPAQVRVPVLHDQEFEGTVRRMSYALKRQARTLLAEIDLPNPEDLLRPGMYVRAAIQAERRNLLVLPTSAVTTEGDVNEGYRDYCFVVEDGKVRRVQVQVGARGEGQVEVLKKMVEGGWEDFTGQEKLVRGGLAALAEGQDVAVAGDR
jgi:RND family efflux transporter MFP subunit